MFIVELYGKNLYNKGDTYKEKIYKFKITISATPSGYISL